MQKQISTSTTRNISYSAIGKIVAFVFQACANIILSRELVSSDYGIVNFAMIQVTLMATLSSFGINNAAVQRNEFSESTLYTAFTIKFILSILIYVILYFAAGYSVYFFNDPNIVRIIRVLAMTIIINTFAFIPSILLSRALEIKKIVIAETAQVLVSAIIAIAMAVLGFKFWSIVIAFVCSNITFVTVMNFFRPCKILFKLDRQVAAELIRYGSSVLLASLVTFAVFNFDNFIVGTVAGSSVLGYYGLAFNWGSMVCGIMSAVVLSVLFPTFSRMQDQPEKVKDAYLEIIRYSAIFCVIWNLTLFCVSDLFLVHVLGKGTEKWLPALTALKVFCVYGVIRSLIEPTNTLLMASGNPKLVLKAGIIVAVVELLLLYPAIKFGSIEVVSAVVLIAYARQVYFSKKYISKIYNVRLSDLADILFPVFGTAIVVYALYYTIRGMISNSFSGMIIAASIVVSTYIILYGFVTGWKHYSWVYRLIIKK